MSLHFICLTATGGVPIFTRKKGDCDTVSKEKKTHSNLHSLHTFAQQRKFQLEINFFTFLF